AADADDDERVAAEREEGEPRAVGRPRELRVAADASHNTWLAAAGGHDVEAAVPVEADPLAVRGPLDRERVVDLRRDAAEPAPVDADRVERLVRPERCE